jgi:hypothetical protein
MLANLHLFLEVLGAVSGLCLALSHVTSGKASRVLGEIGIDIAGAIKEVRASSEPPPAVPLAL